MSGPGEIPKVVLPVKPEDLPTDLRRLRAHADWLEKDLKTTRSMIKLLVDQCPHEGARTWNTGDGDGSQGFECKYCGTVGER